MGRLSSVLAAPLLLCVAAAACGDSLVPGSTYDEPLFAFSGPTLPAGAIQGALDRTGTAPARHPLVTLLWTDLFQRNPDVPAPAHALGSSVNALDDTYRVELYRPPPPEAMMDVAAPSGEIATLAFAEIVMIDDADGDGTFRVSGPRADIAAPDLYLGISMNLLYVARPYSTPQVGSPLGASGGAGTGYEVFRHVCNGQTLAETAPVPTDNAPMIVQSSLILPEGRSCARSHSP